MQSTIIKAKKTYFSIQFTQFVLSCDDFFCYTVSSMTLTTHATIGAVIGQATGNPILGFTLSFISHFLIDIIPHGDLKLSDNFRVYKRKRKQAVAYTTVDAIIAILFILLLFNTKEIISTQNFTWGIVGAVLPDLLVGISELTKSKYLMWINKLHFYFHNLYIKKHGDIPLKYALIAQLIIITFFQTKL